MKHFLKHYKTFTVFCLSFFIFHFTFFICSAQQLIGTVARVKGQEPTMIHGCGIVTGLRGTGDKANEFKETARTLQRMMQLMGHPNVTEKEIGTSKNIALVYVSVTIPPQGARSGETLDVTVTSAGSASSLKDGFLILTDLIGPVPQTPEMTQILAKAQGPLLLEKPETPTVAKVIGGARLTADFRNPYIKDGIVTLVLPERHASFFMTDAIAYAIEGEFGEPLATAHDQSTITVKVPFEYMTNPVQFVAKINAIEIFDVDKIPTVTINERTGGIVATDRVEIAPVAISHKNISIQAGGQQPGAAPQQQEQTPNKWVKVDLEEARGGASNVRLQTLVDMLNQMKVPQQDMIDIIRTIDSNGDLYGKIKYVQ